MSVNDVLTQEEVQALLHEVESGALPTESGLQEDGGVVPYNFSVKERIIRGPLPTLEMIYDRFARHFRSTLYTLLRREATVELTGVEHLKFSDYSASLPTHCGLHLATMRPLQGVALFLLEPHLVYLLVDSFFGGGAREAIKDESRELTPAELRITRIIVQSATKDFEQAWAPVLHVELEHTATETNPHFINIASPTETVLLARFLIHFGAQSGELHAVVPYSMIEPIREMLDAGMCSDRADSAGHWGDHLTGSLQAVSVELKATMVEAELSLRDILQLKPGDVVAVDLPGEVSVQVEGTPLFRGAFGVARGRNSIKVTQSPWADHKRASSQGKVAANGVGKTP
ncbi:MAG: flagellar motor switch protein FliM [Chromatiaceae bacterium]